MKRKLAEHWVPLLSDPWQIRYVYIMAFDDTFGREETPTGWEHTISWRWVKGHGSAEWGGSALLPRTPNQRPLQLGDKIKFY